MKITYYLLVNRKCQKELQKTIRQLFQVEPSIPWRARNVSVGPGRFDLLIEFLHCSLTDMHQVVFTVDYSERESNFEQRVFLGEHRGSIIRQEYNA